MHVWYVQMVAEHNSLSATISALCIVTGLGTHCPVPSPILAEISVSCSQEPVEIWGQRTCSGKKEREEAGPPPPFSPSSIHNSQVPLSDLEC